MEPTILDSPSDTVVALDVFATVPETTLPNGMVVPSFRVGRYLCSRSEAGAPIIDPQLPPWVSIDYHAARAACTAAGVKLLTESQALAIAWNISQQAANWSGGAVGEGDLYQGLHLGTVRSAQPGTHEPHAPAERRWHWLSNGERVFDVSGNAFTWIFDDIQGDADGVIAKALAADSPSLATAPFPSRAKGTGWRPSAGADWSGGVLIRGGCWVSESIDGVFYLDYDWPGYAFDFVGFRCTL